jgi:NAD(P)-dependent dehydrogenase (short-subunit alcohol dehydrogenase family)
MLSMLKNKAEKRLAGRVALVTGASRGIGAAAAQALAAEGAHVILLARTIGAMEEVDDAIQSAGGAATLMPFDLSETKKIDLIGKAVGERFRRLDILIGNAGMLGSLSPVAMSDAKVYEETFRVNFFANYHLIRALDPLLRGSDAGRAVFVTSGVAQSTRPFWSAYASSKAALETMIKTYAAETAYSPLKVNILDPGAVRTSMRSEAKPAEDPETLPLPETLGPLFVDMALPEYSDSGKIIFARKN